MALSAPLARSSTVSSETQQPSKPISWRWPLDLPTWHLILHPVSTTGVWGNVNSGNHEKEGQQLPSEGLETTSSIAPELAVPIAGLQSTSWTTVRWLIEIGKRYYCWRHDHLRHNKQNTASLPPEKHLLCQSKVENQSHPLCCYWLGADSRSWQAAQVSKSHCNTSMLLSAFKEHVLQIKLTVRGTMSWWNTAGWQA